jgi:hypothetical protein
LRRLLTGFGATLALGLTLSVGSASATTVYDYVYSGTYFDGSATGKAFNTEISALEYDRANHIFYVAQGASSAGYIAKVTPAGTGVNFAATGTPFVSLPSANFSSNTQVSLDQTGGPTAGTLYASANGKIYGWDPTGAPRPGVFDRTLSSGGGGIAVLPNGDFLIEGTPVYLGGGRQSRFPPSGDSFSPAFAGYLGMKPSVQRKWSEGGTVQNFVVDNNGEVWGVKTQVFEGEGQLMKMAENGALERFEVNQCSGYLCTRGVAIDHSNDDVFALRNNNTFEMYDNDGRLLGQGWGVPDAGKSYLGLSGEPIGIAVDPATHDVWVANRRDYGGGVARVEKFERTNPHIIPGVSAIKAAYSDPNYDTMTLRGIVNPDGVATTNCHFEWGPTQALGTTLPCDQGNVLTGSTNQEVTVTVSPVSAGQRYWYRLSSKNANNQVALSQPAHFIPQYDPIIHSVLVDQINTDGVRFSSEFDPNGGNGSVHFEWGTNGNFEFSTPESDTVGFETENSNFEGFDYYEPGDYTISQEPTGLTPGTTYEFRAVISNEAKSITTPVQEFTTYVPDSGIDKCANSQVRQQTEASLLPDCRAYELASTTNSGGYDVESDLVPGQAPLAAYPGAKDRLLYSIHVGLIPGIEGSPTNFGLDPYVATRGDDGWTTRYAGLPSDGMTDTGAFGSPLLGADSQLRTFAFGGPNICDPCFADNSTNVPLRKPDGSIVKGMAGSSNPAANPAGEVRKPLSADGSHFLFGANKKFEPAGNEGSVSIYDRNLGNGTTQVVSTLPVTGATMSGEVGELDVSADGSRVVVGQGVSIDAAGNHYWHPYMHIGTDPKSVDLAPTSTTGVLYDGMSADGSKVFFTTKDKLNGTDTDESADLYEAAVGPGGGPAVITRLSTGTPPPVGDTNACDPAANVDGNNWNAVGGASTNSCGVVAIAGGGGVASGDGTVYFFSPEKLDGSGTLNEPNLFVVRPGSAPKFVATLEPNNPTVRDAVKDSEVHRYGDFQVTDDGGYAAFTSENQLTAFDNRELEEVYRFDTSSSTVACPSCPATGAAPATGTTLSEHGLSLTDDGRVFFTTLESFTLRDTNEKRDVYEWKNGVLGLISAGIGRDDSGLVTVSPDGVDAFFYTREKLTPTDVNGNSYRIYDAREGGGFLFDPESPPCAAADECRGAGTQAPGPPNINTPTGSGETPKTHSAKTCPKGKVKRKGKCVRKHKKKKSHSNRRQHG